MTQHCGDLRSGVCLNAPSTQGWGGGLMSDQLCCCVLQGHFLPVCSCPVVVEVCCLSQVKYVFDEVKVDLIEQLSKYLVVFLLPFLSASFLLVLLFLCTYLILTDFLCLPASASSPPPPPPPPPPSSSSSSSSSSFTPSQHESLNPGNTFSI